MTLHFVVDPLRALLTSEARARILTALFAEPERSFYQNELARFTGLRLAAVQRELRRLVAAGIVRSRRVGGRVLYDADPTSAIESELRAIVTKLRGVAAVIRQALEKTRGVQVAWIFGSFASGTAIAASDVDLIIIGSSAVRTIRAALTKAERRLDRSVNEHVVAPSEWRRRVRAKDPFLLELNLTPKLFVIGDESILRRLDRDR